MLFRISMVINFAKAQIYSIININRNVNHDLLECQCDYEPFIYMLIHKTIEISKYHWKMFAIISNWRQFQFQFLFNFNRKSSFLINQFDLFHLIVNLNFQFYNNLYIFLLVFFLHLHSE